MQSSGYRPPKILKKWVRDIPNGDLHELMIFDNGTVCLAGGRTAHSSGSSACSWQEFLGGKLHSQVESAFGAEVLAKSVKYVRGIVGSSRKRWWQFWL